MNYWLGQECAEKADYWNMIYWLVHSRPVPPSWIFIRNFDILGAM